ncbi:isopentenyl-diphosphate delta-isomerase [Arthrobacter sp. PAMC 25486]|uniref:isopentenyl-diphosphate Delta-isomerase n=1 Tax=Arthrobacter sp. PAMC 25486 TaxID=1494608 RepID=UPI000535FECB|nr:isopentenyl-diphosphate Delta-isomerase [Arthrobacter sp. PAMC 25486]AIY03408.1 isopentenyl-diphosphate delta-isomerase [Arthrobacter sp. PAMC 25486]
MGEKIELVRLLDDNGVEIGTADKALVHTAQTPLHLAFSCHLFDAQGRTLLTRRALSKLTWPGVWTNSFCGHPAPGESFEDAIIRRAAVELNIPVSNIKPALPGFRYSATDASGIVENEICPVFTAVYEGDGVISPNPDEVSDWGWSDVVDVEEAVAAVPYAFSPWLVQQLSEGVYTGGRLEA